MSVSRRQILASGSGWYQCKTITIKTTTLGHSRRNQTWIGNTEDRAECCIWVAWFSPVNSSSGHEDMQLLLPNTPELPESESWWHIPDRKVKLFMKREVLGHSYAKNDGTRVQSREWRVNGLIKSHCRKPVTAQLSSHSWYLMIWFCKLFCSQPLTSLISFLRLDTIIIVATIWSWFEPEPPDMNREWRQWRILHWSEMGLEWHHDNMIRW